MNKSDKLLSIYFELPKKFNLKHFEYLKWQDWSDSELLVIASDSELDEFKKEYGQLQNIRFFSINAGQDKDILDKANGSYTTWLTKEEVWTADFLTQARAFLSKHKNNPKLQVLYGIGFVNQNDKSYFGTDVFPQIQQANNIARNFKKPVFLSPCIKYFLNNTIVRHFDLKLSNDIKKEYIKEDLLTIDYFAAIFKQNNYTEPSFDFIPLGFMVHKVEYTSDEDLQKYIQHFLDKREIWESNIWSPVYWASKFAARRQSKISKHTQPQVISSKDVKEDMRDIETDEDEEDSEFL